MTELIKSLENIGLSPKKANIYLALLELGEANVLDISKKTRIKRTTIYNLLPEMINDGLIKATIKSKKRIYFIEDPRQLKSELEGKLRTIEKTLPELRAIQNILPYKPKITFYEGAGGMRELYQDTLNTLSPGDTILSFTGLSDFYKLVPKEFSEWYINERKNKKIKIKVISPISEVSTEWKDSGIRELREIKLVENPDFKFNADTEIYGNKIALISYKENFIGVVIESKEINLMQRMAFELMWSSIPVTSGDEQNKPA
jgi:sugar-specific transcriptional regulator TrmB